MISIDVECSFSLFSLVVSPPITTTRVVLSFSNGQTSWLINHYVIFSFVSHLCKILLTSIWTCLFYFWRQNLIKHCFLFSNLVRNVEYKCTLKNLNLKVTIIKFDSLALRKLLQLMHLHHMFPSRVTFL